MSSFSIICFMAAIFSAVPLTSSEFELSSACISTGPLIMLIAPVPPSLVTSSLSSLSHTLRACSRSRRKIPFMVSAISEASALTTGIISTKIGFISESSMPCKIDATRRTLEETSVMTRTLLKSSEKTTADLFNSGLIDFSNWEA